MTNTLITRTVEHADGTQQIAIFDTSKKPVGDELGLFVSQDGKEVIAPANKKITTKKIGKLIFFGKTYLNKGRNCQLCNIS